MKFEFESLQDISMMPSGYFMDFDGIIAQKDTAIIEGKMLTVFGSPIWQSDNYENSFNYIIKATSEDGRSVIFSVYNMGAIHIGSNQQDDYATEAANALIEYVKSAEPTDYERTVYYLDFLLQLDISVKNGVVTIDQSEISEEKAVELFNKWYNQ